MNQLAHAGSIKGDFANHAWTVRPGYTVTFTTNGNDYLMTIDRPGDQRTQYKVTRTVGSRFIQYYIGVQTEGAEPAGDAVYTTERKRPCGYCFRMKGWLPLGYFDGGENTSEALVDGHVSVDAVDTKWHVVAY